MADFMTAVKTVHKTVNQAPDPVITPVSIQQEIQKGQSENDEKKKIIAVNSPEDALQLLRSEPDVDSLIETLHQLSTRHGLSQDFDIHAPGPLQAQIINALVTIVAPTFWPVLEKDDRSLLISCLRCAAGPSAMVARLKLLCDQSSQAKSSDADCQELEIILSMLDDAIRSNDLAFRIWTGLVQAVSHDVKRQMAWKDFVGLVASGKLTTTIARSEDTLRENGRGTKASFLLSSGVETSAWLGRNIAVCIQQSTQLDLDAADLYGATAQLFARSFGLGYSVAVAKAFWISMISTTASGEQPSRGLTAFLQKLPSHTKQTFLESSLKWLSEETNPTGEEYRTIPQQIQGPAALIDALIKPDPFVQQYLVQLLDNPIASTLTTLTRQACITVLGVAAPSELETLLDKLMGTFGEKVFIDHAPIVQQEAIAQNLLLVAGHIHRKTPMALLMTARSSGHMQSVSARLHSSNSRARWLGMIVGTAISSLVDKEGSQMNFGTDDMHSEEARWYQQLVRVEGQIGTIADLEEALRKRKATANRSRKAVMRVETQKLPIINGKQTFGPPKPPVAVQTEVIGDKITEIGDDEDEEDDDEGLKPYAKPDSDPEDSDDDATLVNRNKPRPPVYIRDLMRMLKDTDNHDKFQMAIKHAPDLIRRKSNFGNEVKDHAEELALMLCDLRDPFETEAFDELKLQTLIAIVLTDVKKMGPWLSRQAFAGEYSLSQRCIMLSALGLSGRELAGFKDDDLNPTLADGATSFPSKRLSGRLHAIYSPKDSSVRRLESASKNIEHQLIKPLALSAADKTTSHLDAVKVRTFSSRMDVQRTKRKPAANELAKVFGECFFFPLLSRYQQEIAAYGPGSVFVSAPFVQVTFLKTLALVLHAAGPATMGLPEITTAFWDLLLSLRVQAISDISVLEAVLFSLLTLLEVNTDSKQRLAQETPKQLMETQQWTELVFEKTGGSNLITEGSDDEARVRTLAAGVLVKTKEVIEAYQKLLIGNTYG